MRRLNNATAKRCNGQTGSAASSGDGQEVRNSTASGK
jgi:hypothetical protein